MMHVNLVTIKAQLENVLIEAEDAWAEDHANDAFMENIRACFDRIWAAIELINEHNP